MANPINIKKQTLIDHIVTRIRAYADDNRQSTPSAAQEIFEEVAKQLKDFGYLDKENAQ